MLAAVAENKQNTKLPQENDLLKSRARVIKCYRKRAPGGGRQFNVPLIRKALYEWFTSIRYAIDWKQLVAENRSRGKKHLARFPRSIFKLKVNEMLQEYVGSCLLVGAPVKVFKPDAWWFKRWEDAHGLSLRCANRKFKVPRTVPKERLELGWVNIIIQVAVLHFTSVLIRSCD